MGLFNKLKNEFIDIIEWTDKTDGLLVHRFNRYQNEIKMGAQLIVRPGQKAIFVREGKIADQFEAGTYTLETKNMPILSTLYGWKYGFNSPFKAEIYFIDTTEQLNRKWGTPNPIMLRDIDFGIVRLRCRGNYSYKIGEQENMLSRFVGAGEEFFADALEDQVRTKIVSSFSDAIAELKIPALDLAAQYDEISDAIKTKLNGYFIKMGLELLSFTLENISLPDDVQNAIDERASMSAVGNLNQYAQYQQAKALRDAANNQGGTGDMMGMMVGANLGGMMGKAQEQIQPKEVIICPKCQQQSPSNAKFCGGCGQSLHIQEQSCVKCNQAIPKDSKFCPLCGAAQEMHCKNCNALLSPTAKFCPECGNSQA